MIGKSGFEERHDHWHLLGIVCSTLPVETYKRAAAADRFVHVHVRVYEIAEVSDDDAIRVDAGVLEDVELFERGFAGDSRVSEDRKIRRNMGLPYGAKHFALVRGDFIPRA